MIGLQPESGAPATLREGTKVVSRDEWLTTAKRRAMDLVRDGELNLAFMRFCVELPAHPEIRNEMVMLGRVLDGLKAFNNGELSTKEAMTKWIHSFT